MGDLPDEPIPDEVGPQKLPWYRLYYAPSVYQIGVLVGLVSISAFFIALILAFFFTIQRQTSAAHIRVPAILWVSTALIVFSSTSIEIARYALRRARIQSYKFWLKATLSLGIAFLLSQIYAWGELYSQSVVIQANARKSVFYAFTGAHGLHVFGGLIVLAFVLLRSQLLIDTESDLRRQRRITAPTIIYWHFMALLWFVLFWFLLRWA